MFYLRLIPTNLFGTVRDMMQDGVSFLIYIKVICECDSNIGVISKQYNLREFIDYFWKYMYIKQQRTQYGNLQNATLNSFPTRRVTVCFVTSRSTLCFPLFTYDLSHSRMTPLTP